MTRLGWILLALFVLLGTGFALSLSGGRAPDVATTAPPPPPPKAREPEGALAVPVAGIDRAALADSWGDPRGDGTRPHKAIDIMAARGTPVIAAAPGRIEKIFESAAGGHTVYVRSADGATVHYYAHLDGYRAGLAEGQQLRTGDLIGTVGASGNADPGAPHLHFEVKQMRPGEGWWQGTEVNPYPLLARKPA